MAGIETSEDSQTAGRGGRSSLAGNATDKALNLLEAAVAPGHPHRLGDIAAAAGVPKASAHRILQNLVTTSFLASDGNGCYGPGPRLRALAARVTQGCEEDQVMRAELEVLGRRVANTVHLGVRTGDTATCLIKVTSPRPVQTASRVGMHLPLHATSIGKCILSGLSDDELTVLMDRVGMPARTEHTITGLDALRAELDRVRAQGFALDEEENEIGVRCLGAPVRDAKGAIVGGVSISSITYLESRETLLGWTDLIRTTADALHGLLG
ncbi:IclR family transcriptional regulator [Streptomyces sp. CA-210063]|uniref:IclR family transcriptional regulator n=1 Tax=Streptomyces sp. CA-210063 TaxID=2801029 RepID=UPI00214B2B1A|nr:IclR family transcriptional regulator [Streptomyces sp. CA-210063]UUU29429.1 IclR family transcriptional regulator [Streptomyces sp. CA-210063]